MTTKTPQSDPTPAAPLELPPGITLEQTIGKLTGSTLYRVEGFNMPWMDSDREALRVYRALQQANESGYFAAQPRTTKAAS